jgi:hypothetical protein
MEVLPSPATGDACIGTDERETAPRAGNIGNYRE